MLREETTKKYRIVNLALTSTYLNIFLFKYGSDMTINL